MSQRFLAVTSKDVVRVLTKIGFCFLRQSGGSHAIYKRDSDKKRTVVPLHSGVIVKRKTLKSILQIAGLTLDEFESLLKE